MTLEFSKVSNKEKKKKNAQFFTPKVVAEFMSHLSKVRNQEMKILDPGAGGGILAAALIKELFMSDIVKKIEVDLYEIDEEIIPLLKQIFKELKEKYFLRGKKLNYKIHEDNFILINKEKWESPDYIGDYDVVISNPPYKKLTKNSEESQVMLDIVHGQPNIYFLFMALATKLLKKNGELIFITPRSYFSGAYFSAFRKWFLNEVDLKRIHAFHSRKNVFSKEKILQETIIIRAKKNKIQSGIIEITESVDAIDNIKIPLFVKEEIILDQGKNRYIKLPLNQEELETLNFMGKWSSTLKKSGYLLSTGPVVEFRNKENIFNKLTLEKNEFPLIWMENFKSYEIKWPINKEKRPQCISGNLKVLVLNQNYLLLKRLTSKEEKRRIQCVPYRREKFSKEYIGIENHVNYLRKIEGEMSNKELEGLFVLFNSSILDIYYRILNGSTQVNAKEINSMPMPTESEILSIANLAKGKDITNSNTCDEVLREIFKGV